MALTAKIWTYDDLVAMPDDGKRYEIIGGELLVSAAPDRRHQESLSETNDLVKGFVRVNRLGRVYFAPVDVVFSPTDVVEPDLVYIRRDRLHIFESARVEGAPDLVVEVLSPSTRRIDLDRKRRLYAVNGVPEYWIVDPFSETVTILVLHNGEYTAQLPDSGGRLHSTVLPGLVFHPATIFAEVL